MMTTQISITMIYKLRKKESDGGLWNYHHSDWENGFWFFNSVTGESRKIPLSKLIEVGFMRLEPQYSNR